MTAGSSGGGGGGLLEAAGRGIVSLGVRLRSAATRVVDGENWVGKRRKQFLKKLLVHLHIFVRQIKILSTTFTGLLRISYLIEGC